MKILLISPTFEGIGGIAQHVQGLMKFLKKNGHQVEVISSENTFTIPVKGLKNPSFMLSSFLKSKFKKNFDIVHAHNIPAAFAMKNSSGKKILTIHGIFSEQIEQLHGKSTGILSEKYEKDALSWANTITAISKESVDHYVNLGFDVIHIPNGIDLSQFDQKEDRRYDKQIIFAGRLSKEKGTDTLIKICKNIPLEINLVIIGEGPEVDKIKQIESECDNIHYLGSKNHEETIALIKGSDVLIQPSLSEGISSTILESMACKTPIITSNVGGNIELIQDCESGFLVSPTNPEMYVQKIIELISDSSLQKKFSTSCYDTVKKYDWEIVGKKYLDLYNSVLDADK